MGDLECIDIGSFEETYIVSLGKQTAHNTNDQQFSQSILFECLTLIRRTMQQTVNVLIIVLCVIYLCQISHQIMHKTVTLIAECFRVHFWAEKCTANALVQFNSLSVKIYLFSTFNNRHKTAYLKSR